MKRAGEILSILFDERLMKKAQGYSRLFSFWTDVTQKNGIAAAADHSRLRELDRGILLVEADHPGWVQILQTKEHRIVADFRRAFPDLDISGISLMLSKNGSGESAGGQEPNEPAALKPAPAALAAGAVLTGGQTENAGYGGIKDGTFKETLKRLEKSIAAKEGC